MTTIHADELQPGDVLVWGGRNRTLTDVDRPRSWVPSGTIAVVQASGSDRLLIGGNDRLEVYRSGAVEDDTVCPELELSTNLRRALIR
jgi:hypothetical protein